jgi:hypothetical protein
MIHQKQYEWLSKETSNGGGVEGDLDVLITNGFTVNYVL